MGWNDIRRGLVTGAAALMFAAPLGPAAHALAGDITVPAGFTVDLLLDQIDGATPRLEAVRNPAYGSGVVAANINDDGILSVLRVSNSGLVVLSTLSGFSPGGTGGSNVMSVRFDRTSLFGGKLFISVATNPNTYSQLYAVEASGNLSSVLGPVGGSSDELQFLVEFVNGGNYIPGAYLEDHDGVDGTSLWHANTSWQPRSLGQHVAPPGRTDLDIKSLKFDTGGIYGGRLYFADSDPNDDNKTAIYALLPDLSWQALTAVVTTSQRFYRDMDVSTGGALGELIYVSESVSQEVQSVDPDGNHATFASGFTGIESVTISEDGNTMYVSDANGICRIRLLGDVPGPTIICQDPNAGPGGVFTNPAGITSARLIFSEAVLFDEDDIAITNGDEPVPFAASGSNSQFMLIAFGEALIDDVYTITVADTVVAADDAAPIDGDEDGLAGGAATTTLQHRCRPDANNDGSIGVPDLLELLSAWGACQ